MHRLIDNVPCEPPPEKLIKFISDINFDVNTAMKRV